MKRVLVVDDEKSIALSIAKKVAPVAQIVAATTVREAKRLLSMRTTWSAFIFDLRLPDGSGLELLEHAREEWPCTPALILTGYPDGEIINRAYEIDAQCLGKPVGLQLIVKFVVGRVSLTVPRASDRWRKQHGLTVTEADILVGVAGGRLLETIAQERRCSLTTVRTHVYSLREKTGAAPLTATVARFLRVAGGDPEDV